MNQYARLEISVPNLTHNFNYFKSKLKEKTKLLVLIKANAYGHGAVGIAKILEKLGADYLAVATVREGMCLKNAGITLPVMILTTGIDSYSNIIDTGLEPGVPNIEYLKVLVDVIKGKGLKNYPVHIALDTGMHRLGFLQRELPELKKFLIEHPEIEVKSLYSHLAAAESPKDDDFTLSQISNFDKMTLDVMSVLPDKPLRHILNSSGIERFSQYQFDMVRLGIGFYGISCIDNKLLKPSSYYRCPVLQIKTLSAEDGTVGYNRYGKLGPGISRIATIPLGYADGIDRHLGRGNASFEINGKLAPTIGTVCMDMCMIDITGIDAKIFDIVTIFGDKPTVSDIANILDTIPYEIFTSISERVDRVSFE